MKNRKIRVLVGKTGLDSDATKARFIARSLRDDGGMEIIYTGLYRTIEELVESAIQEDVDIVLVSIYSGSHMTVFPQLREALNNKSARDIILIGEGLVPDIQIKELKESGTVEEIFKSGTSVKKITEWINRVIAEKRNLEKN